VVLENLTDGISVRKISDEKDSRLPTEQAVIMRMLPPAGAIFCFNSGNADKTRALGDAFRNAVATAPVPRDNFLLTFLLAMIATLLWAFIGRLSRKGREVMDGIDGLRLYLVLAEKDRRALADAPTMSPAHYETLLPYAVALGVEKAWSNRFETALAAARRTGTQGEYHPQWYTESSAGTLARVAEIGDSLGSDASGSSGSGRAGGVVSGW
jgi:hypothetical protein